MAGASILQGQRTVHVLAARRDVEGIVAVVLVRILGVVDRSRHVNVYAADQVNDLLEPLEIQTHIVVNGVPDQLRDGGP